MNLFSELDKDTLRCRKLRAVNIGGDRELLATEIRLANLHLDPLGSQVRLPNDVQEFLPSEACPDSKSQTSDQLGDAVQHDRAALVAWPHAYIQSGEL